jgi:hypothetical protein
MIRGVVLVLLTALLLAAPAAEARPDGVATAATAKKRKKLTCARAKRMHVRKLSRRERKRVLAVRRRCAKAKRKVAAAPAPGSTPSSPSSGGGAPAPGATPTPSDPGGYTVPPPDDNPHALQVVSGEFYLNLAKGTVLSGPVRVEFNNAFAEDPHDLHLVREDGTGPSYAFGTLKAGGIEARTLDLSAGSWQLFCALAEHASRGMTARLKVTG